MTDIATAAVIRLESQNWPQPIYAHRRWRDPVPGSAVIVLSASDDWTAMRTTAEAPTLRAMVYAAPTVGQDNAEGIAITVANKVRKALHRPEGGAQTWAGVWVLSVMHVGSGLFEVEGHESWRVRSLTFEVQVA